MIRLYPNDISLKEALCFVWSLPVSVLITGAENKELVREKIDLANNFTKLSEDERNMLSAKLLERRVIKLNTIRMYKEHKQLMRSK